MPDRQRRGLALRAKSGFVSAFAGRSRGPRLRQCRPRSLRAHARDLLRAGDQRQRSDGACRARVGVRALFEGLCCGRSRSAGAGGRRLAGFRGSTVGLPAQRMAGGGSGSAQGLRHQRQYLLARAHLSHAVEPPGTRRSGSTKRGASAGSARKPRRLRPGGVRLLRTSSPLDGPAGTPPMSLLADVRVEL